MARLSISGLYSFADMQYVNLWQIFIWLHFVKFFFRSSILATWESIFHCRYNRSNE